MNWVSCVIAYACIQSQYGQSIMNYNIWIHANCLYHHRLLVLLPILLYVDNNINLLLLPSSANTLQVVIDGNVKAFLLFVFNNNKE